MPVFTATVTSLVPCYYEAEVEVEAASEQEARDKIKKMYDNDELDFDDGESDFDEARIEGITFDDV